MNDEVDPYLIVPKEPHGKMKGLYKLSWTEDSLAIGSGEQRDDMVHSGSSHIGSSFHIRRYFLFLVCVLLTFTIILGRMFFLQILQGDIYHTRAENNRQRIIPIPSERGLFFDRNNIQLTQNIPNFALIVVPQYLPHNDMELHKLIVELADIVNKDADEIADTINKYRHYQRESIVIEEDIPYETALKIQIASSELQGIGIQRGSKRLYIRDGLNVNLVSSTPDIFEDIGTETSSYMSLSHVLGYVGKLSPDELDMYYDRGYLPSDSIGKSGVEKTYETFVRGIYGKKRIEVDAFGKEQQVLAEESPISGSHLILNIDNEIQKKLEWYIREGMKPIGKTRAAGVAINPQNGERLALVSLPAFDDNDFSGGISSEAYQSYIENKDNPLFDRAIGGTYPSGSVIKPAIASAALQEGVITAKTTVNSVGGISVGPWFFPDWKAGGHGITDVRKSIQWSVNTFYYYIGGGYGDFVGLGVKRITDYLRKFGLAQKMGIDIPGEASGFLPSQEWKKEVKGEPWYVGDTYNLSIGQGDLLVTPLQMTVVTAAIANGGIVYEPHIVGKIIDPQTGEKTDVEPKVLNSGFIDVENLYTIKLGMKDCVTAGSCWDLNRLPFPSGGKTGTAQWNSNADTHAWFTGFAPFDNPEIAVTILVEEGGEGGWVSEPIAGKFLQWWASYKESLE